MKAPILVDFLVLLFEFGVWARSYLLCCLRGVEEIVGLWVGEGFRSALLGIHKASDATVATWCRVVVPCQEHAHTLVR